MSQTKRCTSMMICPPLTNAVFPTTFDPFDRRADQMPITVRMAWGGVKSPIDVPPEERHRGRSNGTGVERPRPAPSPETPARHRPAKMARPARCVRSVDSTFYSPRTKLVFLKDVSAVHYRPGCTKPRFLFYFFFFSFIVIIIIINIVPELSVGRVDPRVGSGPTFMRVYFCHVAYFEGIYGMAVDNCIIILDG